MPSPNDPLHGITLEAILIDLHARFGWAGLAERIDVRCFHNEPSVKSSLKFLRKTPWARAKVEALYLEARRAAR
ncbi:VF530 family protein [Stutzerimonas marianensis]|uniref:VF530 family protein n=1 Tax=Stutzerimonas marianensis TaxID=2929513 RepID=A0A9X2ARW6_9GAMM|nr:VF530 family protein [Pseudomonas marianensis]MCJ0973968.1 VF530 family protein [Pseudomonas marianensis]